MLVGMYPGVRSKMSSTNELSVCSKTSLTSDLNVRSKPSLTNKPNKHSKMLSMSGPNVVWSKAPVPEGTSAMVSSGLSSVDRSKIAVLGWSRALVGAYLKILMDEPNV